MVATVARAMVAGGSLAGGVGAVLCVLVDVVSGRRARWRCDNATVCQSVTASTRMLAPVRNSPCGAEAQFPAHLFLGHDNCSWPTTHRDFQSFHRSRGKIQRSLCQHTCQHRSIFGQIVSPLIHALSIDSY